MINATQLKNGATFLHFNKPYQVIKYTHSKIGRGGALVKLNARNLLTGSLEDFSFSADISFEEADIKKRKLQFLYSDNSNAFFMDPKTYEQIDLSLKILGDKIFFLKEGENTDIIFWEEKALSVELSPKVSLKVVQTDPGVKGNSATNMYKPAVLENNYKVKVPLFIKVGDIVRIDTRTGSYIERAR